MSDKQLTAGDIKKGESVSRQARCGVCKAEKSPNLNAGEFWTLQSLKSSPQSKFWQHDCEGEFKASLKTNQGLLRAALNSQVPDCPDLTYSKWGEAKRWISERVLKERLGAWLEGGKETEPGPIGDLEKGFLTKKYTDLEKEVCQALREIGGQPAPKTSKSSAMEYGIEVYGGGLLDSVKDLIAEKNKGWDCFKAAMDEKHTEPAGVPMSTVLEEDLARMLRPALEDGENKIVAIEEELLIKPVYPDYNPVDKDGKPVEMEGEGYIAWHKRWTAWAIKKGIITGAAENPPPNPCDFPAEQDWCLAWNKWTAENKVPTTKPEDSPAETTKEQGRRS